MDVSEIGGSVFEGLLRERSFSTGDIHIFMYICIY